MEQPGGKLPLFDDDGQQVNPQTVRTCLDHGWAEPWFSNPLKPDWLVCKLTPAGYRVTPLGTDLIDALAPVLDWAGRWADALDAGSR